MINMSKKLDLSFEEAVNRVQNALKEQGFGILTEINVKNVLKKKLGVEYPNYKILGACNPQLAKRALDIEKEVGTLLPCNVIVYEVDKGVQVSIQRPTEMMSILENEEIEKVAQEAESKLKRALDSL